MKKYKSRESFLLVLLGTLLLQSCGLFREVPHRPVLSEEERAEYSRHLGIPLEGKEDPALIREVAGWIGTPYRYGGTSHSGVDCSGFIGHVYRNVYGINLPRTTAAIASDAGRVSRRRLSEGDLVFFRTKSRWRISHAGIYLGNGYFVHASSSRGVIVSSLEEPYYSRRYARGGRFRGRVRR